MQINEQTAFITDIKQELQKSIVGQEQMIDRLLIALLGGGHILLEGVPGLAKTLAIKSLAQAINADFSRIQFTPDLLPSDVTGNTIFNINSNEFVVKKGPIFANFVLADEINRAPAKVQSALLEVMQEQQVSIANETYTLEAPFMVLATQNPLEQEGTYPLPEAQLDRFMLKTTITYPTRDEEQQVMRQNLANVRTDIKPVVTKKQILEAKKHIEQIYLDEKVEQYILNLVFATREPSSPNLKKIKDYIAFGVSPRGTINLARAARVHAFIQKRNYTSPEDVQAICYDVLRHRIGLSYLAQADGVTTDELIKEILANTEVL